MTNSGRSGLSVTFKDGSKGEDGSIREDETDLLSAEIGKSIKLGKGGPSLSGFIIGIIFSGLFESDGNSLSDQSLEGRGREW